MTLKGKRCTVGSRSSEREWKGNFFASGYTLFFLPTGSMGALFRIGSWLLHQLVILRSSERADGTNAREAPDLWESRLLLWPRLHDC